MEIKNFLKENDNKLHEKFDDKNWEACLCYLNDIFEKLNILKKQLEGKKLF